MTARMAGIGVPAARRHRPGPTARGGRWSRSPAAPWASSSSAWSGHGAGPRRRRDTTPATSRPSHFGTRRGRHGRVRRHDAHLVPPVAGSTPTGTTHGPRWTWPSTVRLPWSGQPLHTVADPRGAPHRGAVRDRQPRLHRPRVHQSATSGPPATRPVTRPSTRGPGEVSLPAHATGVTTYAFHAPGPVLFACHLPGHLAYGMQGTVRRDTAVKRTAPAARMR